MVHARSLRRLKNAAVRDDALSMMSPGIRTESECTTHRSLLTARRSTLRKRLFQIPNNVVHVLDADGDADHAIGNSNCRPAFLAERSVRHGGRMGNKGFNSTERFAQGAHAHSLEQAGSIRQRSGLKSDHRAEARHLL